MAVEETLWFHSAAPTTYVVALTARADLLHRVEAELAPYLVRSSQSAQTSVSVTHHIGPPPPQDEMDYICSNRRGNRIWRSRSNGIAYEYGDALVLYDFFDQHVRITTERHDRTAVQSLKRAVYIQLIQHCRNFGFRHLHASAACGVNGSFVFLGDKGAGKTTTVLAALDAGWDFVSNDQVMIGTEEGNWNVFGLPISVHMNDDTRRLFSDCGLPDGNKAMDVAQIAEKFACGVMPSAKLLGCVLLCRDPSARLNIVRIDDAATKICLMQAHGIPLPSMHQIFWPKGIEQETEISPNLPFFVARFAGDDVQDMLARLSGLVGSETL